jgi:transposase
MMGAPIGRQERLFYEFDLEEMVPGDHLLRKVDAVLDLSWLRGEMKAHYNHLGCPSVCPELMVRMLLVGYCYSIRSERRLCQEVKMNLAYRWFCGLGLEDKVPHHSTFSVNRLGRFRDSDILRTVFEEVVCRCMTAGLVGGEGFAVDASVIEANASRFQRVEGSEIGWTDEQRARRPVEEYLAALASDDPPINPKQKPKALSPSDPAAAWTTRGRHKVMFGYSLNYLIDMENSVIVDVEATPTRISKEVDAAEAMIERVAERFALKPDHVAGDVAYGTGEMLGWLVDQEIDPHISSPAPILLTTASATAMSVPPARRLKPRAQSSMAARSSIWPSAATAPLARSSHSVPAAGNDGSRVMSTKMPATIPKR